MSDPLEALAVRVDASPFFLGRVLLAYADSESLDEAGLARALGCAPRVLALLRLCRAPREAAPELGQDLDEIGDRFGVDADRLLSVVRRGQALLRLQAVAPAAHGFLMAARDAEPPREDRP